MSDKNELREKKSLQKVLPGPKGSPFIGSMKEIQKDVLGFFTRLPEQYGDFVKFRFLFWEAYFTNDPALIKHVLLDNHRNYNKQNMDYQNLKPLVGEGLLTSDGDFWLRQRRLIQPAFHKARIQAFSEIMTGSTLEMLERWQQHDPKRPLDITGEMMRLTLSIVGKALFSQDLSQEAATVGEAFSIANEEISLRFRSLFNPPLWVPTQRNRRFASASNSLNSVVDEIIKTRRAELSRGDDQAHQDLLSMLIKARDENSGEGMTDSQLRDEVMTLLLAGHETTANALSWSWFLLSQNPEAEQRLDEELERVLNGRTPNMDDLSKLEYTRWVIQESLRLYPPAWMISRKAIEQDEFNGYLIPTGAIIEISPYVTHRHPKYWDDPLRFIPERFQRDQSEKRPPFAYFPFGGGPRLCIGRDFAMAEAQLVLATIASRYCLEMVPGYPVEPEPLITLRPKFGLQMYVRPR
jgi:cytochrome P450